MLWRPVLIRITPTLPGGATDRRLIDIQAHGIRGQKPWHFRGNRRPIRSKLGKDMNGAQRQLQDAAFIEEYPCKQL